jgi:flavin reductase (DIM6/NTAB) family NADH-FMN oxidoreductase RutF
MTIHGDLLRHLMRHWTTGVTIVTSIRNGQHHGMTVNSFTSLSINPALITVTLANTTRTHRLVLTSGVFGVTILSIDQQELADRFAGRIPEEEDRFKAVEFFTLVTGAPLIVGGLAHLDCHVTQTVILPESTLFIGEVLAGQRIEDNRPLVYFNRSYHRLEQ